MSKKINKSSLLLFASVCALWVLFAAPVLSAPARAWTVQIAAFTDRGDMAETITALERKGVRDVRVHKEGAAYAARAGRYARKKDAVAALAGIRKTYPRAVLKRVPEGAGRVFYGSQAVAAVKKGEAKRQEVGDYAPETVAAALAPGSQKKTEDKPTAAPAKATDPMMEAAVRHCERGEYQAAASLLRQRMRQKAGDPVGYEQAIRKLADCYFSIGQKGSNAYLFSAVDHYKYILQHYADPREGNDRVYDQLARSYEALKFYYEAANAWQALRAKYSESPRGEEALFRLAGVLAKVGRYEQAIEAYRQYLAAYPQGVRNRAAVLQLAESYYQKKDYDNAAILYENIGKNYKEVTEIPKEYLCRIGESTYRNGRYREAIRILSASVSLYPEDEQTQKALYLMGCAFERLELFPTAIKIYNEVIDAYPDSDECRESILKIAMLGGQRTGLRVPVYLTAAAHFEDPLTAYDMLLAARPGRDFEERVRFAKAETLSHQGRYAEAIDEYLRLGEKYPQGQYGTILPGRVKAAVWKLTDVLYDSGDHVAIASLYCKTFGRISFEWNDLDGIMKVADSLHKMSLDEEAIRVLKDAQKVSPDRNAQNLIIKAMQTMNNNVRDLGSLHTRAETPDSSDGASGQPLESLEKALAAAGGNEQRRWLLFEIGRRLSQEKEWTAAERRFSQMREGNPDPFWTKLSEYAVQEARWMERYRHGY